MRQCILVGGGFSVKEGISLGLWEKIKGRDIWSINYAFLTMPYLPSRQVWLDLSFFRNNIDKLQELYIKGVSCYTKKHNKYAGIPEIHTYETTRNPNETHKLFIGRMGLSGFFTLSLAVREEYETIYLLGYDFGNINNDKNTHYYQNELNVQSSGFGRPELYIQNGQVKAEVQDFEVFLGYKTKIINVSPKSYIPYFSKISYEEFFSILDKEKENV